MTINILLSNKSLFAISLLLFNMATPVLAQNSDDVSVEEISPARRINHPVNRSDLRSQVEPESGNSLFRTFDGSFNNLENTEVGAASTQLLRIATPAYADGLSALSGASRQSPRAISNAVFAQSRSIPSQFNTSDFLWQWGQFLDHDIDLTDGSDPAEPENIPVPLGDVYFDPSSSGIQVIPFNRSLYDHNTGTNNARQQLNEITAWIDASNVYGSNRERALALRSNDGSGKLKISAGGFLPFNESGLANAGGSGENLFIAGDVRANEQAGLTTMHTLFVREHNRLTDLISSATPELSGDQIYQKARQLVGAEIQNITFREYLPALLGPGAIPPYRGYDATLNASISNIFSTAAYRYGHSALNETLLRLDELGNESEYGHLALRDAFFNPSTITEQGGIEPILRGLANQKSQSVDAQVIDDVRNFLFGSPGSGGFDLVSLNIQRGRDHGLPSYNQTRIAMGFSAAKNFADISHNPDIQARLAAVYSTVDEVDLWVGGLSEDPLEGSQLGLLFHSIVSDQFKALRDGDRFWYTLHLNTQERAMVESLNLADIIRLNTSIDREINDDVFHVFSENIRPDRNQQPNRPPRRL
jgi:peroxidase